jgi:phosphoribosylaminoimidazole-succinocarboxamide synthase
MPYIPAEVAETPQSLKLTEYLGPPRRGKVRDTYELGGEHLMMVTTDRVSSNDKVLGRTIKHKGAVLNGVSVLWFTEGLDPANHLVGFGAGIDDHLRRFPALQGDKDLQTRAMIVRRAQPEPVECIARGYLAGSGWKDYVQNNGVVCGVQLPPGLRQGDRLPTPIFTPSTKAEKGHDINITEEQAAKLVPGGMETVQLLKQRTLKAYNEGAARAERAGIIIADTKFEYGWYYGELLLIDEVLTPDSSRFWPRPVWERLQLTVNGGVPASLDKQYLRDYLEQFGFADLSDEEAGRIVLPDEQHDHLSEIYVQLLERLYGDGSLQSFYRHRLGIAA